MKNFIKICTLMMCISVSAEEPLRIPRPAGRSSVAGTRDPRSSIRTYPRRKMGNPVKGALATPKSSVAKAPIKTPQSFEQEIEQARNKLKPVDPASVPVKEKTYLPGKPTPQELQDELKRRGKQAPDAQEVPAQAIAVAPPAPAQVPATPAPQAIVSQQDIEEARSKLKQVDKTALPVKEVPHLPGKPTPQELQAEIEKRAQPKQ